jgi:putative peptidoglycan lipid II flippase
MHDSDAPPAESAETRLAFGHRRVFWGVTMLGGATVLAKLAALAKDWLVARQLGAGDELDAYLVAFLIPSYAVVVLAHSFASAFVPTYIRVWQQQGLASAQRLTSRALAAGAPSLVIVTLVLVAAARFVLPIVGMGFDAAKLSLTLALFYPLAGVVIAAGLSAMLAAVLNAHERFVAAAIAPMAIPLGTLVVFWMYEGRFGVYALAAGTTAGFVVELFILTMAVSWRGLLVWPRFGRLEGELRHVGLQYLPIALGGLLMSSSLVVDQAMAASLGSGQVSILSYGGKIVAVVLTAVAASLSTVLFPRFSRMIATGRRHELKLTLRLYAKIIVVAAIPVVALLALFSEPLLRLLFQRGAFTPETTAAVNGVQLWLLPQIPFYILVMLGARLLSALDGNQIVLRIGALNLVVNVIGNYVLMQWFGVNGIAMSTTLVYVIAAATTLLAIRLKLGDTSENGKSPGPLAPV